MKDNTSLSYGNSFQIYISIFFRDQNKLGARIRHKIWGTSFEEYKYLKNKQFGMSKYFGFKQILGSNIFGNHTILGGSNYFVVKTIWC